MRPSPLGPLNARTPGTLRLINVSAPRLSLSTMITSPPRKLNYVSWQTKSLPSTGINLRSKPKSAKPTPALPPKRLLWPSPSRRSKRLKDAIGSTLFQVAAPRVPCHSRAPPPLPPPPSPSSADALTPKAPPPAVLPFMPDLTDRALEPLPTNVAEGPTENNLEEAMLDIQADHPKAPIGVDRSLQEVSNIPPIITPSAGPCAADIERIFAAQFAAFSSQISSQFSALTSRVARIEANNNPAALPAPRAYSPSAPVATLDWASPQDNEDVNFDPVEDFNAEQAWLAADANAAAQRLDTFIEHLFRSINYVPADAALSAQQQSIVYGDYTDAFRAFCERRGLDKSIPFEYSLIPAFNAYLPTFWREKERRSRSAATSITTHHHTHNTTHAAASAGPLLPSHAPSLPPDAQPHPDSPTSTSDSGGKGWTQVGPKGKIVKASYATAAATAATAKPGTQARNAPRPHSTTLAGQTNTLVHASPMPPTLSRIPSRAQLNKMSREDLLSLLRLRFNCTDKISPTLDKSFIVDSILARAAKETPPPKPKPKARLLQTTEFTVIRPIIPGAPPELHQAADLVVRTLKTRMQLQHGRSSPLPVTLLSGRWSSQSSPNFVLIFSGHPPTEAVMQFCRVFTDYFGERSTIIPQSGYARMLINLVPIPRSEDGSLPSPSDILSEMSANPAFHNMTILQDPAWINPEATSKKTGLPKTHASISFSFLDTDGTRASSFHKQPIFMFGGKVKVVKYIAKALLRQCQRCWRLNHSESSCSRPPSTIICPVCGGRHTEDTHGENCPNRSSHSHAGQCDCAPTCFLCRSARLPGKNHSARDASCPLRKRFRPLSSSDVDDTPPADTDVEMTEHAHLSVTRPTPPSQQDFPLLAQSEVTPAPAPRPKVVSTDTPSPIFSVANPRSPTTDELIYLASNPDAMAAFRDILESLKSTSP